MLKIKSAKLNYDPETGEDRLTLYYVDLDPMEWVMFQAYNDLDVIPGWQGRRKQLATEYHHGQRKKK